MSFIFTSALLPLSLTVGKTVVDLLRETKEERTLDELKEILSRVEKKEPLPRPEAIARLAKSYNDERLVLVLGAGVSVDYKVPSWNSLLQKLIADTFTTDEDNEKSRSAVMAKLFDMVLGPNSLIAARYLSLNYRGREKQSKKKHLFELAIRGAIYENIDASFRSETYKEIVEMCVSPGRNCNLNSVITYNYDDILEHHLSGLGIHIPYKPIFSIGQNPSSNELPIYHVHGYLPRTGSLSTLNVITLGDDSYHTQYTDVYRWSNMVQLNKFKDCTCLFVGTSFTDPNQRRLLDIAKQLRGNDDPQHYLIKRRYKTDEIESSVLKVLNADEKIMLEKQEAEVSLVDVVKTLIDAVHKFETNDAQSFGVETIWVDEFSEVPEVLAAIKLGSHK